MVEQSASASKPKYDFPGLICGALWLQAACSERHSARTPESTALSNPSVISIIDDDGSVRAATYNLVRSLGYVVHTFESAGEFLRSPHLNETSCVIADIQMPAMSGLELHAHLLAEGYRVPFIFITAFSSENARTQALKAGASCYLTKPFTGEALINCLDVALRKHDEGMSR